MAAKSSQSHQTPPQPAPKHHTRSGELVGDITLIGFSISTLAFIHQYKIRSKGSGNIIVVEDERNVDFLHGYADNDSIDQIKDQLWTPSGPTSTQGKMSDESGIHECSNHNSCWKMWNEIPILSSSSPIDDDAESIKPIPSTTMRSTDKKSEVKVNGLRFLRTAESAHPIRTASRSSIAIPTKPQKPHILRRRARSSTSPHNNVVKSDEGHNTRDGKVIPKSQRLRDVIDSMIFGYHDPQDDTASNGIRNFKNWSKGVFREIRDRFNGTYAKRKSTTVYSGLQEEHLTTRGGDDDVYIEPQDEEIKVSKLTDVDSDDDDENGILTVQDNWARLVDGQWVSLSSGPTFRFGSLNTNESVLWKYLMAVQSNIPFEQGLLDVLNKMSYTLMSSSIRIQDELSKIAYSTFMFHPLRRIIINSDNSADSILKWASTTLLPRDNVVRTSGTGTHLIRDAIDIDERSETVAMTRVGQSLLVDIPALILRANSHQISTSAISGLVETAIINDQRLSGSASNNGMMPLGSWIPQKGLQSSLIRPWMRYIRTHPSTRNSVVFVRVKRMTRLIPKSLIGKDSMEHDQIVYLEAEETLQGKPLTERAIRYASGLLSSQEDSQSLVRIRGDFFVACTASVGTFAHLLDSQSVYKAPLHQLETLTRHRVATIQLFWSERIFFNMPQCVIYLADTPWGLRILSQGANWAETGRTVQDVVSPTETYVARKTDKHFMDSWIIEINNDSNNGWLYKNLPWVECTPDQIYEEVLYQIRNSGGFSKECTDIHRTPFAEIEPKAWSFASTVGKLKNSTYFVPFGHVVPNAKSWNLRPTTDGKIGYGLAPRSSEEVNNEMDITTDVPINPYLNLHFATPWAKPHNDRISDCNDINMESGTQRAIEVANRVIQPSKTVTIKPQRGSARACTWLMCPIRVIDHIMYTSAKTPHVSLVAKWPALFLLLYIFIMLGIVIGGSLYIFRRISI